MRVSFLVFTLFYSLFSLSQHNNELYNDGALIRVQSGAEVHVQGDVHMNRATGILSNDGFIKMQGNAYSDNLFQQNGTGTYRVDNSDVNTTERQFISGSYAVRGGQSLIGVNDGSFYNLELANSQGVVYLVGNGNIADVRGSVDFEAGSVLNNIITNDIGLTGAIAYPANGSNYTAVFGMMNNASGLGNFINNTISTNGNMSGTDAGYVIGNLRRSIDALGGNYGYIVGLEPAGANLMRGVQYVRIDFGANNYDVISSFFESQSPNNSPVVLDCSGNTMNYFGGSDHGEWMFSDITGAGAGAYSLFVWPQDDNFMVSSPWLITKDNLIQGTADECGPTPVGLSRSGFNGFAATSEFNVASTLTPLPAELLKIWAESKKDFITVNWEVASEDNLDYYQLERSIDGMNFEYLVSIPALGVNGSVLAYNHDDFDVSRNQLYYYRYKAVDFDGGYDYSPVVTGKLHNSENGQNDAFNVFPNPSNSDFNLAFNSIQAKTLNCEVINAVGQAVFVERLHVEAGYSVFPLASSEWAPGVYMLKITDSISDRAIWKKIIKN